MPSHTVAQMPQPNSEMGAQRVMTALILDDNAVDRMRFRKLCRQAGLHLRAAEVSTLREFAAALESGPFDLVFIDYHLGMETGIEALGLLTAHPDQVGAIPIMFTSVARCDVAVTAMREGCADYLVKEELSVESLRHAITGAVERRILLGALSEARVFRSNLRSIVGRFSRSCGPEMRGILAGLLRQVRAIRRKEAADGDLGPHLTMVEQGATDLLTLLDDLVSMLDAVELEIGDQAPRPRLS